MFRLWILCCLSWDRCLPDTVTSRIPSRSRREGGRRTQDLAWQKCPPYFRTSRWVYVKRCSHCTPLVLVHFLSDPVPYLHGDFFVLCPWLPFVQMKIAFASWVLCSSSVLKYCFPSRDFDCWEQFDKATRFWNYLKKDSGNESRVPFWASSATDLMLRKWNRSVQLGRSYQTSTATTGSKQCTVKQRDKPTKTKRKFCTKRKPVGDDRQSHHTVKSRWLAQSHQGSSISRKGIYRYIHVCDIYKYFEYMNQFFLSPTVTFLPLKLPLSRGR